MKYQSPQKGQTFRKIMAIIYLSPTGRLFLYALGITLLALVTLLISGNKFEKFYMIFGMILLILILLNWISYAIHLSQHRDETDEDA